jgi:hypothetical protein
MHNILVDWTKKMFKHHKTFSRFFIRSLAENIFSHEPNYQRKKENSPCCEFAKLETI